VEKGMGCMILGLSHMTFIVKVLEQASVFWKSIFGAKEVYASGDRTFSVAREKFFLVGDMWICIMEGEPTKARDYTHIAFHIAEKDFDEFVMRIKKTCADIKEDRPRIEGEGRSIYFYDFDNHLFELHTGSLQARLKGYSTASNADL
jgi:catechol 2,3-dioxygenase-like lactoylglutathione lyase family enzyme